MKRKNRGFTLIELLAVIAIIGIIAGLTTHLAKITSQKKKTEAAKAVRERLMSAIDSYHSALGHYPPDNGLISTTTNPTTVQGLAFTNQLFYELLSAPVTEQNSKVLYFTGYDGGQISPATYKAFFNLEGAANSLPGEARSFMAPPPQTNQYKSYGNGVMGFVAPVARDLANSGQPNFVCYDASSQFRHNKESYDLWVVYSQGNHMETNGNW